MKICVSIIIPIYNVETYLEDCLESVIHQTLEEIEIICVNDGSTDNSPQIVKAYAQKDNRIKIINQKNRGLSVARNSGFDIARGEYIYYLDSDDYIELNALEEFYKYASQENLDVLFCDGDIHFETRELEEKMINTSPVFRKRGKYDGVYSGKELFKKMITNRDYQTQVSLHFAKREFIIKQNLSFYEGILYEDNLYTLALILNAGRVGYLPQSLFHYRIRENSIMTSDRISFHNFYSALCIYFEQLKIIQRIDEDSLRSATATQLEEIYKRIQKTYKIAKGQFLSYKEIRLLEKLEKLEKTLMKQLGFEFKFIPLFPFDKVPYGAKIILYGAGEVGQHYFKEIRACNFCEVVKWVDKRYKQVSKELSEDIVSQDVISQVEFDYIVLAIKNEVEVKEVCEMLCSKNIKGDKIIWIPVRYINI